MEFNNAKYTLVYGENVVCFSKWNNGVVLISSRKSFIDKQNQRRFAWKENSNSINEAKELLSTLISKGYKNISIQ